MLHGDSPGDSIFDVLISPIICLRTNPLHNLAISRFLMKFSVDNEVFNNNNNNNIFHIKM